MALQLEFTGFPDAESPLRWAKVPWDSANFGFPCYELDLGSAPVDFLDANLRPLLRRLAGEGRCFIAARTPFGAVALSEKLSQHAFYHVEALVEVHASIEGVSIPAVPPVPDVRFEVFSHADRDAVAALASKVFVADRFHLDPNLSNDGASRRYSYFVRAAFDSSEEVNGFRHLKSGDIIAFSCWRYPSSRHANWMLGGVAQTVRNSGFRAFGAYAITGFMRNLSECGFRTVETRISLAGGHLSMYEKLGFRVRTGVNVHHWHQF